MAALIVLSMTLLLIGALVYVSIRYDDPRGTPGPEPRPEPEPAAPAEPLPESLEGVLVHQLAEGHINRTQYRRAMTRIAAREDERHPLAVPPETGATGPTEGA